MAEVKNQGAVDAMEVAEASRETEWEKPSFVGQLFLGNLDLDLIHPFPEQPAADKAEADEFLKGQLKLVKAEYSALLANELAGLNELLRKRGLPPVLIVQP